MPSSRNVDINYGFDDNPSWYLSIFIALQHYLTMIGAIVAIPFILTPALCMEDENPARGKIISTMIFITGIVTWIQATWGCRLPLVQGGTISFLVPTLAILNLPEYKCPDKATIAQMIPEDREELWQSRMRELSGAIALAALFQVFIGYTGLISRFLKIITPLTIAPTVALVGLSLSRHAAQTASSHWGIAVGTTAMLTIFSQALAGVQVPYIVYRKGYGLDIKRFAPFKLFPVLLTIVIMWTLCAILTVLDVWETGHPARTDARIQILNDASWFRIPYPGQFGWPTVHISGILGMLAGVLACTVESISYYPTVAKMCGAAPPPLHAINRGIGTEGLGTMLAGLWGSGNGTNTFGENVGAIGVTKVGSRRVIQWAALLMILQGVIGKLGAIFIMIPDPVVGGIFCVMFGMICAFGLGALQYVDLRSSRNLYIIGLSLFFPLVFCPWLQENDVIKTGNDTLNAVLSVLLGTTILVGGAIGCLLDHILPGTDEERGITAWNKEISFGVPDNSEELSTYDFPYGMNYLRKMKWTSKIPFMPTYIPPKKE